MRKTGYTGRRIKYLSYMMAAIIGFMPPCTVFAVETEMEAETSEETEETLTDENNTETDENTEADDNTGIDDNAETEESAEIKYIAAFERLPEEDSYFPCMYKPELEELLSVFPETLSVYFEGEITTSDVEVTWVCEDDFENTAYEYYVFYPQWEETQYAISDSAADDMEIPSIVVEVPSDTGIIKDLEEAKSSLQNILQGKSILALVYLCDEYEVKQSASQESETLQTVVSGQSVLITDVELDEYGSVWYQVLLYQNGSEYTGYVEKEYLATSDEDFADWEDTYLDFSAVPMLMAASAGYPDVDQFPASYQNALYDLKDKHPDWTFVRMDTGLDWNTVIKNELGDKSLIRSTTSGSWQNGVYGQGWSYASEGILKYYMDPRNFLSDPYIFQFEQLTYNKSYHTTETVQEIIKSSFMSAGIPGDSQTYAQAFAKIGAALGISPFHLASRVLQEQGTKGTSPLISGTYKGYEGYYNYFNVGASGKTDAEVVVSGLKSAVSYGWNTRYQSLYGGALIIGSNYILKGQDTLYLEKFNVSNGRYANFTHQYMQNIQAPASEASGIRKAYANAGALENSFVFKIPVYNNMPASACSKPDVTDTVTLNKTSVDALEIGKSVTLIPYVNGSKVDHLGNMTFTSSDTSVATVDSQGKVTAVSPGTATINCTGSKTNTASCTVTVIKTNPDVATPNLSPVVYREGLKLSDIPLPDAWKWADGSTALSVGTFSYSAVYTPEDTTKYNTVTKDVSFTVTKAIPNCQVPEKLEAQIGTVLGDVALPDGFVWESNAETELTQAGEYIFYVSYNPDENNYYTVSNIPVVLRIVGDEPVSPGDDGTGGSSSTSSGSTSNGSTSGSGSTTSTGSTSSGSTSGSGSTTSTGSTSSGSTSSSGSTTSTGSTSSGSTSSSGNTTSAGSTSSGSTSGSGMTSTGSTSTGSTSGSSSTTSTGSTSSGSTSGSGTTSTGSTSTGSTSGGSTSGSGSTTSTGSTSSVSTSSSASAISSAGTSDVNTSVPSGETSTGNPAGGNVSTENVSNGNVLAENPTGWTASSGNNLPGSEAGANTSIESGSSPDNNNSNSNGNSNNNSSNAAPGAEAPVNNTESGSVTVVKPAAGNTTQQMPVTENAVEEEALEGNTDTVAETQETVAEQITYKPSVTIQMDDTTILTAETLQMAKEQNFNLLLDMGDYAAWSIDIDLVNVDTFTVADMGVTFGTNTIPQELIAAILNGNKYIEMTLAHDGNFGFNPVLKVALSPADCGRYANLFYYNPEPGALEFICDSIIDADGIATFSLEHASCYVIIVSDQSMADILTATDTDNYMTKWIILGVFLCMVAVVAVQIVFFLRKKRREEEDEDEDGNGEDEEEYFEDEEYSDEETEEYLEDENEDAYEEYLDEDTELNEIEIEEIGMEDMEEEEEEKPKEKQTSQRKKLLTKPSEPEEDNDEDDWIEDDEWQEPEVPDRKPVDRFADDHAENDWIEDDEWDSGNDWIDDEEWEKKNRQKVDDKR